MSQRLHAEWLSDPIDGVAPIVLLHGFTQTSRAWGRFGELLTARFPVLAVDLPGHGGSGEVRADLEVAARLVDDIVAEVIAGPAIVLGYSMGGRIALHLALRHPAWLTGLVLVSTTAGIDDVDERAERRRADERLADRIEEIGVDAFIDEWLAQPMFAALDADAAASDERQRNSAEGLASSLRLAGTGTQEPSWSRLGTIEVATLVVTGSRDEKFSVLGRRLVDEIGTNASATVIPDAGHNAPLDRPDRAVQAISEWLT